MQSEAFDLLRFGIDLDATSNTVDGSSIDTHGFGKGYILRQHKSHIETERGTNECRYDWSSYVGPVSAWGNQSKIIGNLMSLGLPMGIPERLALCAYISEFSSIHGSSIWLFVDVPPKLTSTTKYLTDGFLADHIMETSQNATLDIYTDKLCVNGTENQVNESTAGAKQLQSRILLELVKIDPDCGDQLVEMWQEMVSTAVNQPKVFRDLDEYLEFRIIDTGCGFSGGVILFGMGIKLTDEEHKIAREVVLSVWRAQALINDYFSFDREYRDFSESGETTLINSVWLYMQWEGLGIDAAKEAVREKALKFEQKFLQDRNEFFKGYTYEKTGLARYVEGWYYATSANIWWSAVCPRYHSAPPKPEHTYSLIGEIKERLGGISIGKTLTPNDLTGSSEIEANYEAFERWTGKKWESMSENETSAFPALTANEERGHPKEALGTKHLLAPYEYLTSLPSKGVREAFVDSLDLWFSIPDNLLAQVKDIGNKLHTASILLDDIEDNSPLRRGEKAAHVVYGEGQAINSANFLIVWAMNETRKLGGPVFSDIFFEESQNALIGQSYEMHWRDNRECPTEEEYLEMVEKKTGGLFRFLTRVMTALSRNKTYDLELDGLAYMIGQYFQIRDDFLNLTNTTYADLKGFCEDLDEGKFSYPIIHSWKAQSAGSSRLQTLFEERHKTKSMTREAKEQVLTILRKNGSFYYTGRKMKQLEKEIDDEVCRLEGITGKKNWSLRLLLHKLATKK
ncbi:hypothetical protein TWF281_010760 [Arthrobotrys megalospora]